MLHGYGDPDLLAEALEAGASGYILKSAIPQQIIRKEVRKMTTLPGFSAEASLYATTESYRMVRASANPTTGLVPASNGVPGCYVYTTRKECWGLVMMCRVCCTSGH